MSSEAEADNVVLRHLRELRIHMDARFDEHTLRFVKLEARMSDVEGITRTTLTEVVGVARRLDHVEKDLRVVERLTDLEGQLAELRRRMDS
jgi:hypothetical protein